MNEFEERIKKYRNKLNTEKERELFDQFIGMTDRESCNHQLKYWVEGIPLHNIIRNECCPDFSCCSGGEMMDISIRLRFAEAVKSSDDDTKMAILGMALGRAINTICPDKKLRIAGDPVIEH